jgi:hypothetical protein
MSFSHIPYRPDEIASRRDPIEARLRRKEARTSRLASVLVCLGTMLAALAALKSMEGAAESLRIALGLSGGVLAFFGFRLRAAQRSLPALRLEWEVAERLAPLVPEEIADLERVVASHGELVRTMDQWRTEGVTLRLRDRDAINAYLTREGADQADVEVDLLDRYLQLEAVPA